MSRNAKTVAWPPAHDQLERSQLTTRMHFQPTKKEELRSFLFLTVVMAPVLTGVIIAGYGFLVWMFQILAGPPSG